MQLAGSAIGMVGRKPTTSLCTTWCGSRRFTHEPANCYQTEKTGSWPYFWVQYAKFRVGYHGRRGKRNVHAFEVYDRTTGSLHMQVPGAPGDLFFYFDQLMSLSPEAQTAARPHSMCFHAGRGYAAGQTASEKCLISLVRMFYSLSRD